MVPKTKGGARFFTKIIFFKFYLAHKELEFFEKVLESPGIVLEFHIQLRLGTLSQLKSVLHGVD